MERRLVLVTVAAVAVFGLALARLRVVPGSPEHDGLPEMMSAVGAAARDIVLAPDTMLVKGVLPQRATLKALLRGHGVADDAAAGVAQAASRVFDLRRLRSLQPFSMVRTLEGALRLFEYRIDADRSLRVIHASTGVLGWTAEIVPVPKVVEQAVASGRIDRDTPSLFQAMDAAGEGDQLAVDMAAIFSGEVDFNGGLQPGDGFALAFERHVRDGWPTTYGAIAAAELRNEGRVLRAIRFAPPGREAGYYDERGQSLKRFFLRSPLKFEPRVTSRFSSSRRHPILHTSRAHRGIDYAAPVGAPVVAAAGGIVASVSTDSTNGRMVRVRHASGYESRYLHLSAFAQGLRDGARVEQGETLGYVGSSGLATGPHLHYGLTKDGVFVNPLVEQRNLPPPEPMSPDLLAQFAKVRTEALARLADAAPASDHRTASIRPFPALLLATRFADGRGAMPVR